MALRIEYFRKDEKVMVVSCPKSIEDAQVDALAGLIQYDAEIAVIRDMDAGGKKVAAVKK